MEKLLIIIYAMSIAINLGAASIAFAIGAYLPKPHKYWAWAILFLLWVMLKGPITLAFLLGFAPL